VEEGGFFLRRWGLFGGRFGFGFGDGVGFLVPMVGLRSCLLPFVRMRVPRGGRWECRGVFSLFGHCLVGGVGLD